MTTRILVIEDNPTNMQLLVYLLEAFGYRPLCAVDGEQGLNVALREKPALIICDIQLPKLNGYEVARLFKSHPVLRDIPLIAMTAFAMVGDRERLLAAGFDAYFSKPIEPESFIQWLRHYLPRGYQPPPPAPAPAGVAAPSPPTKNCTLLVLDNTPSNLALARSLFESLGYQVHTASNIREALRQAQALLPDLILSDICMAEGNGYDFIKLVKADPQLRAIPFVFITSTKVEEADRAAGRALGAAKHIIRPIEAQALVAEIEACLQERKEVQYGEDTDR